MEKKNDFKPFISADKVLPEFTVTSVILGMILAVIFGGANAYLGLRVGMTVSSLHSSGSYFHGCDPCDLKERFHP